MTCPPPATAAAAADRSERGGPESSIIRRPARVKLIYLYCKHIIVIYSSNRTDKTEIARIL